MNSWSRRSYCLYKQRFELLVTVNVPSRAVFFLVAFNLGVLGYFFFSFFFSFGQADLHSKYPLLKRKKKRDLPFCVLHSTNLTLTLYHFAFFCEKIRSMSHYEKSLKLPASPNMSLYVNKDKLQLSRHQIN